MWESNCYLYFLPSHNFPVFLTHMLYLAWQTTSQLNILGVSYPTTNGVLLYADRTVLLCRTLTLWALLGSSRTTLRPVPLNSVLILVGVMKVL